MKEISLVLLIFVFSFCGVFVMAQEDEQISIPPGMEIIQSGTVKLIIPQGSKVNRDGSLIIVEDIGAYVGRRFLDVENSLTELRTNEQRLEKIIGQLRKDLEEINVVLDKMQLNNAKE